MVNKLREFGFLIISIFIFLLDFFSKYFLINFYDLGSKGRVSITPFLDFILVLNPGISFGLFSSGEDIQRWILSILSIIISATCRGPIPADLAKDKAIGEAMSPCSGAFVGEKIILGILSILSSLMFTAIWMAVSNTL